MTERDQSQESAAIQKLYQAVEIALVEAEHVKGHGGPHVIIGLDNAQILLALLRERQEPSEEAFVMPVDDLRPALKQALANAEREPEPALTYEESMTETRRYAADHPEWAAYFREKHGREPGVVPAAEPDHGYIGFAPFYISEQQFLATWGNDWSGNPVRITITPTRQASSDIELLVSRGERAPAVPDLEKLAGDWELEALNRAGREHMASDTLLRRCARELREALKMENHNV